jgi:DNA-binding MarR family transcriptional regulator
MAKEPTDAQYARLLAFRVALRRFLSWSEKQANAVGLTAAQHQLLLAVRGLTDPAGPTITDIANYLLIRHHSAIGLLQRVEALDLVERQPDPADQRLVRVRLTPFGHERVRALAAPTVEELRRVTPLLDIFTDEEPASTSRGAGSGTNR